MKQNSRMVKVLALLVVAMTITAALLVWIEPSSTSAQDIVPLLAAQQAERVVAFDVGVPEGRWRQIEVAMFPNASAVRFSTLTAIMPRDRFHFVVGANGFIRATTFWLGQEGIGEPSDIVRVGVACEPNSPVSFVQKLALEALLNELERQCSPPGVRLSVLVQNARDAGDAGGKLDGEWSLLLAHVEPKS